MALPLHLPALEFTGFVAHVLKPLLLFVFATFMSRSASLVNLYGQENYSRQRRKKKQERKLERGKKLQIGENIKPTLGTLDHRKSHAVCAVCRQRMQTSRLKGWLGWLKSEKKNSKDSRLNDQQSIRIWSIYILEQFVQMLEACFNHGTNRQCSFSMLVLRYVPNVRYWLKIWNN